MSRFSRFEHLESTRAEKKDDRQTDEALKRFEEAPSGEPVNTDAVRAPDPVERRFDDSLPVERHDDDVIPFRRCENCQRDESKFQTRCSSCGADLTTPEALQATSRAWHEREALQTLAAETRAPSQPGLDDAQIQAQLQALATEDRARLSSQRQAVGAVGAVLVVVGLLVSGFWASVFCISFGAMLLASLLPASVLRALGRPAHRGPWR